VKLDFMETGMAVYADNPQSSSRAFQLRMTLFCFLLSLPFLTIPALARQEKAAQPLKQDETCLACHGQSDMKSEKGKSISIRTEIFKVHSQPK